MGDVLHALPAVAALKRAHPDWRVDWAVEPRWGAMLVGAGKVSGPVVDGIVAVRTREWNKRPLFCGDGAGCAWVAGSYRESSTTFVMDLQGTMRSAVVGRMAGAGRFVGPEEPREGPAMHLYGETVGASAVHVVDQAFEIVGRVAGGISPGGRRSRG